MHQVSDQQLLIIQQQHVEEERRRLEEEKRKKQAAKKELSIKKDVVKVTKTDPGKRKVFASCSLSELHALRLRLESAEGILSQHVHICLGDEGVHDCGLKITNLEVDTKTEILEYQTSKECQKRILKQGND